MLFKEAGSFTTKARWMAGMSAAALLAAGVGVARPGFRTALPASAPAKSAPARTRPIVAQEQSRIAANFGNLPLSFEPNRGQTDGQVKFLSRNSHYNLFLTPDEAVFTLPTRSIDKNTNRLPIEGTMRIWRTARGFGCGSILAYVADLSLPSLASSSAATSERRMSVSYDFSGQTANRHWWG